EPLPREGHGAVDVLPLVPVEGREVDEGIRGLLPGFRPGPGRARRNPARAVGTQARLLTSGTLARIPRRAHLIPTRTCSPSRKGQAHPSRTGTARTTHVHGPCPGRTSPA